MSGLTMCTEGCAERYLNGAPVISETPKMSRKDKRRANLCMADGCDSGGKHDWYETNDLFCAEHYLPKLQERFEEVRAALGNLCYAIDPQYPPGHSWLGVAKHCTEKVESLKRAVADWRSDAVEGENQCERLERKVAMLEQERGPGMKPEPAPITCDIGAMYE